MDNRKKVSVLMFALALTLVPFFGFKPVMAADDGKMSMTIIPPFFTLALNPGETWSSSIKVVNSNDYDLPVYTTLMNFKAEGEEGRGKLTPIVGPGAEAVPNTLSQWITVTPGPVIVSRQDRTEIPFTVHIPKDAPPGGHYAAILVGTKPADFRKEGPTMEVTSYISSLLFIRVSGNVSEQGDIREFSSEKSLYQKPNTVFTLRFENSGNVHLQPQGYITIYNMWGKERGRIAINQDTEFGYVMPQSLRKFQFEWKGENNFFEVGRYKAVANLTFGDQARQNVDSATYFWIIPLKPTIGILVGLILFIWAVLWGIKRYIRKTLALQAASLGIPSGNVQRHLKSKTAAMAISAGQVYKETKIVSPDELSGLKGFLKKNILFLLFMVVLVAGILGVVYYFSQVLKSERDYEMTVRRNDGTKMVVPKGNAQDQIPDRPDDAGIKVVPVNQSSGMDIKNPK